MPRTTFRLNISGKGVRGIVKSLNELQICPDTQCFYAFLGVASIQQNQSIEVAEEITQLHSTGYP